MFLLAICIYSCKKVAISSRENNYSLYIKFDKIKDGTKVYLKKQGNLISELIDSSTTSNNLVNFTGYNSSPKLYAILVKNIDQEFYPIIEEGEILVEIYTDDIYSTRITGTKSNNLMNQYLTESKKINHGINDLFLKIQKARTQNNLQELNRINLKIKSIVNKSNSHSINFIKKHPSSIVSSILLLRLVRNKTNIPRDTLKKLYLNLDPYLKNNEYSEKISVILSL